MKADHLKPDTYMKNDKDLMIEELKVSAQPLPTLCVGTCMWGIASQRGDHIWGDHTWGLHTTCSCSSGSSWKILNDTGRSHLGAVPSPSPPPPSPSPPPPSPSPQLSPYPHYPHRHRPHRLPTPSPSASAIALPTALPITPLTTITLPIACPHRRCLASLPSPSPPLPPSPSPPRAASLTPPPSPRRSPCHLRLRPSPAPPQPPPGPLPCPPPPPTAAPPSVTLTPNIIMYSSLTIISVSPTSSCTAP
jgi:hypothetical protein